MGMEQADTIFETWASDMRRYVTPKRQILLDEVAAELRASQPSCREESARCTREVTSRWLSHSTLDAADIEMVAAIRALWNSAYKKVLQVSC